MAKVTQIKFKAKVKSNKVGKLKTRKKRKNGKTRA